MISHWFSKLVYVSHYVYTWLKVLGDKTLVNLFHLTFTNLEEGVLTFFYFKPWIYHNLDFDYYCFHLCYYQNLLLMLPLPLLLLEFIVIVVIIIAIIIIITICYCCCCHCYYYRGTSLIINFCSKVCEDSWRDIHGPIDSCGSQNLKFVSFSNSDTLTVLFYLK